MNFSKDLKYNTLVAIALVVLIPVCAWFVINEARAPLGLTAGPVLCIDAVTPSVTVKKPLTTTPIIAGTPFTVAWSACYSPGPYTVSLQYTNGTSVVLGTTPEMHNKKLTATIDPTTTPAGNYFVTVTSSNSTLGTSEMVPIASSFVAQVVTPATCTLDAANPEGTGKLRYCDVIYDDSQISMNTVQYATAPSIDSTLAGATTNLMMDIYMPTNDPTTNRPFAVVAHAGGAQRGDFQPTDFCKEFVGRGYVCGSIDFRGAGTESGFTPYYQKLAQSDMQAAIRYFRVNARTYGIDPNKAVVGGFSAGAITAVQSAISGNNITDAYFKDSKVNTTNADQPSWSCFAYSQAGAATGPVLALLDAADPAIAMYHGVLDTTVTYSVAVDTQADMAALGIPSTLLSFSDAGHKVGHPEEIDADFFPKAYDQVILQGCPRVPID